MSQGGDTPRRTSLDRGRIRVVFFDGVHPAAVERFAAAGYTQLVQHKGASESDALIEAIRGAHMVGVRSRTQLTRPVIEAADKLIAVGCFCIGTDQVDLEVAEARGIPVFNAPFSNTRSVAELVLGEIIMLLRGIPERNARAHRGVWTKTAGGSREARGKCLGIVGYGHIGTQVGLLAEALGMQVVFYDIEAKLALGNATAMHSLDELLERADVVTLHVPETPQTARMIGRDQIELMRRDSLLLNAARGSVIDVDALCAALSSGHLAGAAVDVFPDEPPSNDKEFISPLREFDNVLLTPHIGGSTLEAQQNIGLEVAEKLIRYSDNGSTLSAVNFPEVALPEHPGKHRFLHIHENRPGMLSRVNEVFSRHGVNVAGQYLQTDARIGYVVIDVDPGNGMSENDTIALRREIETIEGTIRTRVLY